MPTTGRRRSSTSISFEARLAKARRCTRQAAGSRLKNAFISALSRWQHRSASTYFYGAVVTLQIAVDSGVRARVSSRYIAFRLRHETAVRMAFARRSYLRCRAACHARSFCQLYLQKAVIGSMSFPPLAEYRPRSLASNTSLPAAKLLPRKSRPPQSTRFSNARVAQQHRSQKAVLSICAQCTAQVRNRDPKVNNPQRKLLNPV